MSETERIQELLKPWIPADDERKAVAIAICSPPGDTGIRDDNHALLVGRIMGTLHKQDGLGTIGMSRLSPEPVMHNGDYTNKIAVTQPSGRYVITVEPA